MGCGVQVVVWGWKHGLAGHPETLLAPVSVPGLPSNTHARLAAGRVHSLIATTAAGADTQQSSETRGRNDALYAFGNGQNGRLGLGSSQSVFEPQLVQDIEGLSIKDVACGHDHSLVLTST